MDNKATATLLWEGERLVLERRYNTLFPVVLIIIGGLVSLSCVMGRNEVGIVLGIVLFVVGIIVRNYCKVHLVVTTKRVFVSAPFGRRMNLPLNHTTAVGTAIFRSLYIGSSSGRIYLSLVPEHLDVYNAITALLNQVE